MNIIEAWKLAREGQAIQKKLRPVLLILGTKDPEFLRGELLKLPMDDILDDDWAVVKEKKVFNYISQMPQIMRVMKDTTGDEVFGIKILAGDKITVEREE